MNVVTERPSLQHTVCLLVDVEQVPLSFHHLAEIKPSVNKCFYEEMHDFPPELKNYDNACRLLCDGLEASVH